MPSPQETDQAQYVVGREGLKIPVVTGVGNEGINVVNFFRSMWELNGFEFSRDEYGRVVEERRFGHELVIPGDRDHSLVVLKGSYDPRKQEEIDYESRRHREQAEWGRVQPTTLGYERHGVYVPPASLGQFLPYVKVEYRHETGSSLGDRVAVTHQGSCLREGDFYPEDDTRIVHEKWEEARTKYAAHLAGVLSKTVEFLS